MTSENLDSAIYLVAAKSTAVGVAQDAYDAANAAAISAQRTADQLDDIAQQRHRDLMQARQELALAERSLSSVAVEHARSRSDDRKVR